MIPRVGSEVRHASRRRGPTGTLLIVVLLSAVLLAGCTQPGTGPGPGADGDGGDGDGTAAPAATFTDVAAGDGAGIAYRRAPSTLMDLFHDFVRRGDVQRSDLQDHPTKPAGAPGVALLDFDGDGDLDIFATNGPGAPHRLYANQLQERGELAFADVAGAVGVAAPWQDGTGTCFGDLDNDGDPDLVVLGRDQPHLLFENRLVPDGTALFDNVTADAGLGTGQGAVACSLGDVDGDGHLDLAVANTFADWTSMRAIESVMWEKNAPNHLFRNTFAHTGELSFEDISDSSGLRDLVGVPEANGTITWAIALVDLDRDGDVDVVHGDDQGGINDEAHGGTDRGWLRVLLNDGTGHLTDTTSRANTDVAGSWMGLAFADLDADGRLDLFGTNLGDYLISPEGGYTRGLLASDWFLQTDPPAGTGPGYGPRFVRPGVGDAVRATPFGWGTSVLDADNDGDSDIVFHGGMEMGPMALADNPGVLLINDGTGVFDLEMTYSTEPGHLRRGGSGVAVGDLDLDGFADIVSVANYRIGDDVALHGFQRDWGSPLDDLAGFARIMERQSNGTYEWTGFTYEEGDLAVEMNDGLGDRGSVAVRTTGMVGLTDAGTGGDGAGDGDGTGGARVNRDGIGAVVAVWPGPPDASDAPVGPAQRRPVLGGSSYASQDALELVFGLGEATTATVEVLWPGGADGPVRNRLYDVQAGERVTVPEIPCSFDTATLDRDAYEACVDEALADAVAAGVVDQALADRLQASALRAYDAAR